MDDQRTDREGWGGMRPMTPKEQRFARQLRIIGGVVFVLSWFHVVSAIIGRLALVLVVFGGPIARGFDSPLGQSSNKENEPK